MPDLNQLVRKTLALAGNQEFKPCAFYQSELDLIVVLSRDCSYTEELVPEVPGLNILRDNYPEAHQAGTVGIALYGARELLEKNKIFQINGRTYVYHLLRFLSRRSPKLARDMWLIDHEFPSEVSINMT